MRDYGRVFSRFWNSEDIRSLTDDGRLLALYLLTCLHGHLAGTFFLPIGYAAEDMQWPRERVEQGFRELSSKGFATRCEATNWVWVCKYLGWNWPENPNQFKAARKQAANIPTKCAWRADFQRSFAPITAPIIVPEQKSLGTLPQGSPTQEQYKDQDQEQDKEQEQDKDRGPNGSHTLGGAGKRSPSNGHANGHDSPAETATFQQIRQLFPARSGSHRWADALSGYLDNLRAGITEQAMLDGTKRYAAYCKAENIEGQVAVQSARTFFGPNKSFLEPWESGKKLTAAERWMREQESKDAH